MYEFVKVGERTYFVDCPTRIGVFNYADNEVCLFDSGNDASAAKKVLKGLSELSLVPKIVLNTHSHADHIGGNKLLESRANCKVYAGGTDLAFVKYTELQAAYIAGSYPLSEFRTDKFFRAEESHPEELTAEVLPNGVAALPLEGHSFFMNAFKTSDDVWFLGDVVTGENIINKYHISFLVNIEKQLEALDTVEKLEGKLFIPSHSEPLSDIRPLVKLNRDKLYEICELLVSICSEPLCFDDLLAKVFVHYGTPMNVTQHALVGSTIRSYLSYLHDKGRMTADVDSSTRLVWKSI